MQKILTVSQIENHYEVKVASNNNLVGKFIQDVDGFFYFSQEERGGGLWSDYVLLEIGTALKEINRPWCEILEREFSQEEPQNLNFNEEESNT